MLKRMVGILVALPLLFVLFSGCGGGGGANQQPSSNWDEMVWDQDNWA